MTMAEARKWLESVGLGDAAEKRPAELSGGMQRDRTAEAVGHGAVACRVGDQPFAGGTAQHGNLR